MDHVRVRVAGGRMADRGEPGRGARAAGRGRLVRRRCPRPGGDAAPTVPGYVDRVRLTLGDAVMPRFGPMYGPDVTFLGVPRCDLSDVDTYAGADAVIVGAPFDGGTSFRPGTRFGPSAIRQACYLDHDGSRPSLALRVDGLQDLRVLDAGDVEMFGGDVMRSIAALEAAVYSVAQAGAVPIVLGGDHTIALPDASGVPPELGSGGGVLVT